MNGLMLSDRDEDPQRTAPRLGTLSGRVVAKVRTALFERRFRPGDFLGTEAELAATAGASRIVARDALRTLEALGIVEIRAGAGGGARIARGNPRLFAEALAVQLELTGVSVAEIMEAQRAIETQAAESAAARADASDVARLHALCDQAAGCLDDADAFTRSSQAFHLAVAEAAHNRVLQFQLISLQHVAWPSRNRSLTRPVAEQILAVHRELAAMIEARDGEGARRLMDVHVQMIRDRRLAERPSDVRSEPGCC